MNKKLFKLAKAKNREKAIEDGFYDGRFKEKTFVDKKRKALDQIKHKNRFFE